MKKTLYTILSIGILLLSVILILPVTVTSVVTVVLGGGEEEEGGNSGDDSVSVSVSLLLSEEVEAYRNQVLKETEKHKMEAYIDLVSCCHAAGKWGKWQRCFSGIGK